MKLLLLDRPKDPEITKNLPVEYFGPWAQPITYPDELEKPYFVPYPTPESVYNAGIRSVNKASEILDTLCNIMPEITGIKDKGPIFWKILYGHLVVTISGIVEDINVRCQALPENDYTLGVPYGKNTNLYPKTWMESMDLVFHNEQDRCWVTSLILNTSFKNKNEIKYAHNTIFKYSGKSPRLEYVLGNVINILRSRILLKKISMFYRKYVSVIFKDPDEINSLIWDSPMLFSSVRQNNLIFRENIIRKKNLYNCSNVDVDVSKREKIKTALPFPIGDLLARYIPISSFEGLKDLINTIDISNLKTYKNLRKIYSHGHIIAEYDFWRVAGALLANQGLKIMSVQHGGAINYYSHPSIFLEGELLDKYISWGFNDWHVRAKEKFSTKHPRSRPSLYLTQLKKSKEHKASKRKWKKKWKILLLVFSENKNIKWLYSPLFPDLAYDYFGRQKILFEFFQNQRQSVVKLYPVEYGWDHKNWIITKFPKLHCEYKAKNFVDYIKDTEITIVDYNSTGFLEMIVLRSPFLCTWNRRWFRGNDLFEECLDKLEQVGIFYDHPDKLIDAYENIISKDVLTWWDNKKRMQVVKEVAKQIALTSENSEDEWSVELGK